MLISALCDYYDVLASRGQVVPDGYSRVKIHYLVALTPNGALADLVDFQLRVTVAKGKTKQEKAEPRQLLLPKRTEKTAIESNIAEHRAKYLFGLNYVTNALNPEDATNKAKKSHEAFVAKQLEFLSGLESPLINAFRNFVLSWQPEQERNNPLLLGLGKGLESDGFAFCLAGHPELLLHDDPTFRAAWDKLQEQASPVAEEISQCAVSGKNEPIALIHSKIMGVPGGASTGSALVCYKSSAMESYGKKQSLNSNISRAAMRKYTEALSNLMSDRNRRVLLDDLVIVHWAVADSDLYDQAIDIGVFQGFGLNAETMDADETQEFLCTMWQKAQQAALNGKSLDVSAYLDPNVSFYIAGLKSNSSRLALEFVCRNRFGDLLLNIAQHQTDIQMEGDGRPVPLWRIKNELVKPKSKSDRADPALISRLLEAILNGYPYPAALLETALRRIKSDSNSDDNTYIKLNPLRAGLIKGYLNRKARSSGQKEEFLMGLDKENLHPAYLCGRLFAALEDLQQAAAGQKLNRTIKDAYFTSACCTPAVIFPRLLTLAQHHIAKASYGGYWNKQIGEIIGQLGGEFPRTLCLEDQGRFILGYYHQSTAKYESSTKTENTAEEEEN